MDCDEEHEHEHPAYAREEAARWRNPSGESFGTMGRNRGFRTFGLAPASGG